MTKQNENRVVDVYNAVPVRVDVRKKSAVPKGAALFLRREKYLY